MKVFAGKLVAAAGSLNRRLDRPLTEFSTDEICPARHNIGHFRIDKNYLGYELEEITSASGGARGISPRMTARQLMLYMDGLRTGLDLSGK